MASWQPLGAGLALAAYRRQMARRTAWLACLRRTSLWLDPLLAAYLPLRAGPLLGTTLAALAAEADASADERAAPDRRARDSDRQQGAAARGRPSPPFAAAERPGVATPQPVGGAPAHPSGGPTDVPRPPRHAASAVGDLPRQAPSALLAPFGGAVLPAADRRTERLGQVGHLTARMGSGWQTPGGERSARPGGDAQSRPAATLSPSFPAPMDAAWSARLDGPTASLSLLTRSANRAAEPSSNEAARPRAAGSATSPPKDDPRPAPSPRPPDARAAQDTPFADASGAPFAPSLWGLLDYRVAASAAMPPPPDPETTVRVVNPTLASRLPFLTPTEPGGPGDLPLAAATARQGARAEVGGEEDLDELAAKLKRILNEEARRHGIGV